MNPTLNHINDWQEVVLCYKCGSLAYKLVPHIQRIVSAYNRYMFGYNQTLSRFIDNTDIFNVHHRVVVAYHQYIQTNESKTQRLKEELRYWTRRGWMENMTFQKNMAKRTEVRLFPPQPIPKVSNSFVTQLWTECKSFVYYIAINIRSMFCDNYSVVTTKRAVCQTILSGETVWLLNETNGEKPIRKAIILWFLTHLSPETGGVLIGFRYRLLKLILLSFEYILIPLKKSVQLIHHLKQVIKC